MPDTTTLTDAAQVSDHTALLGYLTNPNLRWNYGQDLRTAVVISYSFVTSGDLPTTTEYNPYDAARYWAFSDYEQRIFREALDVFEAVAGVIFVETQSEAMINVFGADAFSVGGWADYAYTTETYTSTGRLVTADRDMQPGTYGFQVLLHELGHALGLRHPHDGGDLILSPDLDNPRNTVMTYNNGGITVRTLGGLDVTALRQIYGDVTQTSDWNAYADTDGMITVSASARAEIVMATGQDTRIFALGGNDTVLGREGSDDLNGGTGNDSMIGNGGDDMLVGGDGDDYLIGDTTTNTYSGGNDTIFGGAGADYIEAGYGNDLVNGGWQRDTIIGGSGNDTLRGNFGADQITGGDENDQIFGEGGRDNIGGDAGNDQIYGGNGGDTILGGTGNDIIGGGNGADQILGQSGEDSLYAGAGNDIVAGGTENDVVGGGAGNDQVNGGTGEDTIYGGDGADVLSGNGNADTIYGGDWADVIYGGIGDDFLSGGDGADTLVGGSGHDTLVGGAGADTFRFSTVDYFYDDTVRDFQNGVDLIILDIDGLSFGDLSFFNFNGNTSVSGAGNLALTLLNVDASQLDASDFLFV